MYHFTKHNYCLHHITNRCMHQYNSNKLQNHIIIDIYHFTENNYLFNHNYTIHYLVILNYSYKFRICFILNILDNFINIFHIDYQYLDKILQLYSNYNLCIHQHNYYILLINTFHLYYIYDTDFFNMFVKDLRHQIKDYYRYKYLSKLILLDNYCLVIMMNIQHHLRK